MPKRATIRERLVARIDRWVTRRLKRSAAPIVLSRDHGLYILPTRYGYLSSILLFAMLMVAMNYNNSMVFLMTFLLGALVFISMTHVHRSLLELELHAGIASDVFAGETAWFPVRIENVTKRARHSIALRWNERDSEPVMVPAGDVAVVQMPLQATQRGMLRAPRLSPWTSFPFGLFRAWAWGHLAMDCVVYPKPATGEWPIPEGEGGSDAKRRGHGEDEFAGLREYQPGDSPRRIAWKVAARGQGLATKQFESGGEKQTVLDFDQLVGLDTESRLSRLCRWVLDCEEQGLSYSLNLPGRRISSSQGPVHQRECLRALALYAPPGAAA